MLNTEIDKIKNDLIDQLNNVSIDILKKIPTEIYINAIFKYPQYISHKYINKKIKQIILIIEEMSDLSTLESYHKLILIYLIERSIDGDLLNTFPLEIKNLFLNNFELIIEKIKSPRAKKGFFLYSEEKFNKFMAISRLKMIPCGAQKVYAGSLPKKFLFQGDVFQFFKGIYLILKTGGRKPFFKMHTDSTDRHLMKEFNPDGLDAFFKRIEILMKRQTQIKGICGSSWFFDPALKEISPELSYIREISESYGASFFDLGSNKGIIKDATFMSPKRIKLYKQGEYIPNAFLMIITRKALLKNLS